MATFFARCDVCDTLTMVSTDGDEDNEALCYDCSEELAREREMLEVSA